MIFQNEFPNYHSLTRTCTYDSYNIYYMPNSAGTVIAIDADGNQFDIAVGALVLVPAMPKEADAL